MPSFYDAALTTDGMVFEYNVSNKFFADYGSIDSISSDGSTCDIKHLSLLTFDGETSNNPIISKDIELLYLSSSEMSISMSPKIGDTVLMIGLKNFLPSTVPNLSPSTPFSFDHYNYSTIKAIPLSAINSGSGVTFRAKSGKIRLRNTTVSLFTALNDFQSAISTFSGVTSQAAITAGGVGLPQTVALASAINGLLSSMNASLVSVANEISALLED
jgi:hypothetical protein